ncbi:AAA family ATPase [Streptomyces sp. YC504]|uniref:AAA family ATPase n=1 Tax=Streptomyces mesophilus TaxID=1775132 RepID=A0A6G4XM73_9ACTN|nr:UvrD-helicase domain-containing protein [Streptomyces mesophilus]NGO78282.1 AAA family ATPase [Streptomyces mesophilus]
MRSEQEFVARVYARLGQLQAAAEQSAESALAQVGTGRQARLERDVAVIEKGRLVAELNGVENGLVFGRIDLNHPDNLVEERDNFHIGRIGIRADDQERTPILIDWRADVARPFYLATSHVPMGLRRRRHITMQGHEVVALHDEILDLSDEERTGFEDPNGDAVLLAALNSARTGRMGDIVQTIQAEQDRIIRAPHQGVLVVEGGPGTGKTAVALHRAAYLLYAQRELLAKRAVLIVGPNPAFLGYIGEVLPSLGETGVLLATVGELFPGVKATGEDTQDAAEVKGRAAMAEVLASYVSDHQSVPDTVLEVDHEDHGMLLVDRAMAEEARTAAREMRLPHNLARPYFAFRIIDALTEQLVERIGADPFGGPNLLGPDDIAQLGKDVATSAAVHGAIADLWPELTPQRLVREFLADPVGYLPDADAESIRRSTGATSPWTSADIPLLDEAAELLGVDDSAERARQEAERQRRIEYAQGVLDLSFASRTYEFEDKEELYDDKADAAEVLSAHDIIDAERMAERQEEEDLRSAAERAAADRTWAFGHIIVDEAQELSAMAWRLLMRRSPTKSMTLVGDPAQTGDAAALGSWSSILAPYVGDRFEHVRLRVNYRTPSEVMDLAAAVLRSIHPGLEPPRSVRSTGVAPRFVPVSASELASRTGELVSEFLPDEGRLAVIAPRELHAELAAHLPEVTPGGEPDLTHRVVLLDARQSKGLEFDSVLVVEPGALHASDLYVALTRATQTLGVLHSAGLPDGLRAMS